MFQVLLCKRGEDVILVTLNHLDSIRELVGDSEKHISMLNTACKTVTDVCGQKLIFPCIPFYILHIICVTVIGSFAVLQ